MFLFTMMPPAVSFADTVTDPAVTADPTVTSDPAVTSDPDATQDPEVTSDPASTTDPSATDDPLASPNAEPKITVLGSTIKKDNDYFELSLKIDSDKVGFSTVGIALEYEANVIYPVSWDSEGTSVTMESTSDWQNVASLPAVAPEELSGKTALAYHKSPNGGNPDVTATPEASANPDATEGPSEAPEEPTPSPTPADNIQARDEGDNTEATSSPEVTSDPDATADPDVTADPDATPEATTEPTAPPTPLPTIDPENRTTGYLYLSSEAALPIANQLSENAQCTVTVRFRYVGDDKETKALNKERIIRGFENCEVVRLAPDETAAESPAGQSVVYSTGIEDKDFYYTQDKDKTNGLKIGKLLKEAPKFVLEKDVESKRKGGGSDPSKFAALVFFDWDESTLLGSMVVDSSMETAEIIESINSFNVTQMPPGTDMTGWNDEMAKKFTVYDTNYPFTSHNGYSFGKWIDFDSEYFTVYGDAVAANNASSMVYDDTPPDPDFSSISGGKVLKAAYIANDLMKPELLPNAGVRKYTISNGEAMQDGSYDPNDGYFGIFSDTDYAVRVKVTRVNSDINPIYRPRETAIRAVFKVGSTQISSLATLKNIDEQIVEIAAPSGAESVSFTVIDIGGVDNWASVSAARSDGFVVNSSDYVLVGRVIYFNEYPDSVDLNSSFTAPSKNEFEEMGITLPAATASGRRNAVKAIARERDKKLTDTGKKYLTLQELKNAVERGDYTNNG